MSRHVGVWFSAKRVKYKDSERGEMEDDSDVYTGKRAGRVEEEKEDGDGEGEEEDDDDDDVSLPATAKSPSVVPDVPVPVSALS